MTQLRRRLAEHGWEVVEVAESDDWWADEYWRVQSHRNLWGLEIAITFLVDPMWDAPRKRGQGVWAITATEDIPTDRLSAERSIAELCRTRGQFDEKLSEFIASIDVYRNDREKVVEGQD